MAGFFGALQKAYHIARETDTALQAGRAVLEAGGSPLTALRAFSAATDGRLDDATVDTLERGVRKGIEVLERAAAGVAWVAAHEEPIKRGVTKATTVAIDWGYQAGRWRYILKGWLDGDAARD